MNKYESLLSLDENVTVVEKHFKSKAKGLCKGNKIGISKDIETSTEKACVLAEELGHYYTTVGNIIDLTDAGNRKQERQARLWAYNKQIGLQGIINAYKRGCVDCHEIAEYLEVTEEFLCDAIDCYREKYGIYAILDNYAVYFIPNLAVMEII